MAVEESHIADQGQAKRIFVSHSSADKQWVRQIVRSLQDRGHEVWFDEASLSFGDAVRSSISERILRSDIFLLLYSKDAAASKWVDFEIQEYCRAQSQAARARMVPVSLDGTPLPAALKDQKRITATQSRPLLTSQILLAIDGATWNSLLWSREECRSDAVFVRRGPVRVGRDNRQDYVDHDFLIDRYPVSRRKFMSFCYFGGYQDLSNYSARARPYMETACAELLALAPMALLGARFPLDLERLDWLDFPMCRLTAYEAEAYCRWVGGRLPRNSEWDKAAREDSGHPYPWGDALDEGKCFTGLGPHSTSDYLLPFRVDAYPAGQSPCGAFNMAGRKQEYVGELAAANPDEFNDEILTRGWLPYVDRSAQAPPCSLVLESGCFPVAGAAHAITFRTAYSLESSFDALVPRRH